MKGLSDYLYYEEKNPDLKIYCGDFREVVPLLKNIDLLLTDPPYGIGVDVAMCKKSGKQYGRAAAPNGNYELTDWDSKTPTELDFQMLLTIAKYKVIWGGNYFPLPPSRCILVWDKMNDVGNNAFADCELAWTNFDKPVRIKHHMWNGMLRMAQEQRWGHPTQKPVGVIKWCLSFCDGLTLDPFLGSGTTLVACKELNRNGIGIEISEKYCAIAKSRLKNTTRSLFHVNQPNEIPTPDLFPDSSE